MGNGLIEIPLTRGYVTLIDEIDADLSRLAWHANVTCARAVYACRNVVVNGTPVHLSLHRVILARMLGLELGSRDYCDHKDHDGMNNTRTNLRLATSVENTRNRRPWHNSQTGELGVYWAKDRNKWVANIKTSEKRMKLGAFDSFEEAVQARRRAEREYFGEFAPHQSVDAEVEAAMGWAEEGEGI
jgi:hypothetical protein